MERTYGLSIGEPRQGKLHSEVVPPTAFEGARKVSADNPASGVCTHWVPANAKELASDGKVLVLV